MKIMIEEMLDNSFYPQRLKNIDMVNLLKFMHRSNHIDTVTMGYAVKYTVRDEDVVRLLKLSPRSLKSMAKDLDEDGGEILSFSWGLTEDGDICFQVVLRDHNDYNHYKLLYYNNSVKKSWYLDDVTRLG